MAGGRQSAGRAEPGDVAGAALNPEQFASRYEEVRGTLWYIAAAILGDRTGAHDVVQEAATIAMGKLGEFDPSSNFTAWMGQIVRYVALNEARSRQRRRTAVTSPEAISPGSIVSAGGRHAVQDPPGVEQFDDHVAAVLMTLDETARTCLLLRVVRGLAYHEIAAALGIPEGTAMSHVHRSRMALRERLAPHGDARERGRP
jgi:RNA polymerase sigma-70 factor (ECF subfamily)